MSQAPASSLALRLHLWRRAVLAVDRQDSIPIPDGDGSLVHIHMSEKTEHPPAIQQLVAAMLARNPDLRFLVTGGAIPMDAFPDPSVVVTLPVPRDPATVRQMVQALAPRILMILGDQLPAALIAGVTEAGIPVILAEARLVAYTRRSSWRGAINRGLMSRISRILVPDQSAAGAAMQLGADPAQIETTGPIVETIPPLPANEAERRALAQILRARHIWLAAAPTMPEVTAVLLAHQSTLHHNHRALLIIAGLPPELVPEVQKECERLGLASILRTEDHDPEDDDHVLIAEDSYEMGLWYRLAPVCFMGGTLMRGEGLEPRHPFEPAALGSAIIHGPIPGPHAAEWNQLGSAEAARLIADQDALTKAVDDLTAPDQAATLARNAWAISTGGAAVLRTIADRVLDTMEGKV